MLEMYLKFLLVVCFIAFWAAIIYGYFTLGWLVPTIMAVFIGPLLIVAIKDVLK